VTQRSTRPWWPLLGVLTVLTYNTWVLWSPMNGQPAIFNGYLSELSASDQPHNLFFRGGDLITAVIVGALGLRALRSWPRLSPARRRWWVVAAAALILFGVSTFLDAFFSMDCSPTLSAQCKVLEETGQLSAVHYAHTFTSVGAQTGIVTSMVATYVAMRRARVGSDRWQRLLLGVAILEVTALTVMMVMLALGVPGLGFPQAVMVVIGSLWFAAVGIALSRDESALPRTLAPQWEDLHAG
jgi:hypothetical protein